MLLFIYLYIYIVVCNSKKELKMIKKIGLLFLITILMACSGDDDGSCSGASSVSASAISDFQSANTEANCLVVKTALENQRDVCGNLSSSLTDTLSELSCN